jgi:LemA protein
MDPVIVFAVLVVLLLAALVWLLLIYNRFINLRQHVDESWSGIDVELKRRYDLIPNLVETVKGYARQERETFELVTAARTRAMAPHASEAERAVDETVLALGMKQLFAVAEAYPDLKADVNFLALQRELANTEDRIAASRRFFNANVRDLNQLCGAFPTNLVARQFGFHPRTFFELSSEAERVVPRVSLEA